ncbi:MAG: hypothetical protein ACT4PE_05615 [Candidatus Eiseniibacteriota bacterium]
MSKTPEGRILKACLDYLAANGIAAWRINVTGVPIAGQPGRFRPAPSRGIADIIAIAPLKTYDRRSFGLPPVTMRQPTPIAVEVKSERGRQSPAQRAFALKWEAAGGIYIIARSVQELGAKLRQAGVKTRVR